MFNLYLIPAIISFVALLVFIFISDRKVLFYNASFFLFVSIANLGYFFLGNARCVEEAILANKITYVCGCILSLFLLMVVSDACKIKLPKLVRVLLYVFTATVIMLSMTVGYNGWFYKSCSIEQVGGVTRLVKEYGPAHMLFLIMMYGDMTFAIIMLISSIIKRKKLVYTNVLLLLFSYVSTVFFYSFGRRVIDVIDPVCISYCINDITLLFVTYNTYLYNTDEALLTSVEKQDYQGYMMFDRHYKYVGCNHVAIKFIPALENQQLARRLDTSESEVLSRINSMIEKYDGEDVRENISFDGKDIEVSISYLYKVNRVRGYIVRISDDSKQQEYIRQINQASNNKSVFLSNVSHEIRTPINAVLGMNEMILRECPDDKIKKYALGIETSGRTLLQIINDILDLSKIESGKFEVLSEEYNLADMINDVENIIRPLIRKDTTEFVIEASRDLPQTLYGDEGRIKQMIINVLNNAVKYTERGFIKFKISGVREDDIYTFQFIVSDTGRGIRESDMERLFSAFERAEQFKNSGIEGTGLGLAITKKFAVMMGGDVTVQSTYGEGSTFIITIPQKIIGYDLMGDYRANRRVRTKEPYSESFHAPNAKLLVIDDVEMNMVVIRQLLKKTQIQIECLGSGEECIEAVKNAHYDMILLDHMMPNMDGVETLRVLRDEHLCDDTPIIALTANVDVNSEEKYYEYGFDGYIPKPIPPKKLEEIIRSMLTPNLIE